MQLLENTPKLFVPQIIRPKVKSEVVHEPKVNSRIIDNVILGLLVVLSFGVIAIVFAFI